MEDELKTKADMATRKHSKIIYIGDLDVGGDLPVRLQSMTNTPTLDTEATVQQSIRMIEAGAEMVRITARDMAEAENLKEIKSRLQAAGYNQPLIADVHFNPAVAEVAARIVHKVRINPGNYADKRSGFEGKEISDAEYRNELERVRERVLPLLKICQEEGTALRIGVNHGSLSGRIMNRYGNTVEGMCESAMEFVRICREEDFHRLVLSMKSSNTLVMVQATRRLLQAMTAEGYWYPLHLGVTEAGAGEDGRIRSAMGIGSLLADGIGDTIRVSLSEAPEAELPVARTLVKRFAGIRGVVFPENLRTEMPKQHGPEEKHPLLKKAPVMMDLTSGMVPVVKDYIQCGYSYKPEERLFEAENAAADMAFMARFDREAPQGMYQLLPFMQWQRHQQESEQIIPLFAPDSYRDAPVAHPLINVLMIDPLVPLEELKELENDTLVYLFRYQPKEGLEKGRRYLQDMRREGLHRPVILNFDYFDIEPEHFATQAAVDAAPFFMDRLAEGICLSSPEEGYLSLFKQTSFGILQAARLRQEGVEYISCPTCGRTQFDLMKVTEEVKQATHHLKGIKIAIMGCIVNGPGEMADADYGYVGAGPGKVHIYRKQQAVLKNVPQEEAIDQLLALINNANRCD